MSYRNLPIGSHFPEILNVVVEIPKGSHNKFEYDEALDLIKLDRVLHSSVFYPTGYGFIPETRSEDEDHLDVMVLVSDPVFPGCVLSARVIGLADMDDEGGKDWKIMAVAEKDPSNAKVQTLSDIEPHSLDVIQNFFEVYKQLENKVVTFNGWLPKEKAFEVIRTAHQRYLNETKA